MTWEIAMRHARQLAVKYERKVRVFGFRSRNHSRWLYGVRWQGEPPA